MRNRATAIGVAGVLCCLVGGASALAATASGTPAGGAIRVFVQPGAKQGSGTILITGAVGDFGTTRGFQVHGKTYTEATLQRGKIEFNLTTVSNKVNKASPKIDAATCSGSIAVSAPVAIVGGTGLYASISGTATITESFGFIGPRYTSGSKKGQCNMSSSAPPVAEMASVHGVGTVSF